MTAPTEADTYRRIEAAPYAPEALRERVARAIYNEGAYCGDCPYDGWESCPVCRRLNGEYADAAIAVVRGMA